MDADFISEAKHNFAMAWERSLPSRELPSLDFLNDNDQAFGQFRHSMAVINDCLTTIKVEVFIVRFLRASILPGEKCTTGPKLAFAIDEIVSDLESVFPSKNRGDEEENVNHTIVTDEKQASSVEIVSQRDENAADVDKTTTESVKDDEKHDQHVSCENGWNNRQNDVKHSEKDSSEDLETILNSEGDKSFSENADNVNMPLHTTSQRANKEQVTIFTPIGNINTENENDFTQTETDSSVSKTSTPGETSATYSADEADHAGNMTVEVPKLAEGEDEVQSSGNELDAMDNTYDPFSSDSCSNSPDPINQSSFLQDGGSHGSGEILKIMPYTSRSSVYHVDPSLIEKAQFGAAEHIYEDIDRYRVAVDEEREEERRHLSQSDLTLKKTFSVGAIRHHNLADDVFEKGGNSTEAHGDMQNVPEDKLLVPTNTTAAHKRSSSDACVSYNVRPNRAGRGRNKERGFQVIDQHGVSASDGRLKNIQSALEQAVDDEHKLHMRKWVVAGLVDSERGYVEALDKLTRPMKAIKASLTTSSPICNVFEYHRIYEKVEELHKIHSQFLSDMEKRFNNWNLKQIIGDLFTVLMEQFPTYQDYMKNNKFALETIAKCKSSETFKNIFVQEITLLATQEMLTYENLFRKPLERIARYILAMDDLIKYTPEEHPDYEMLQAFMKNAQNFLESNCSPQAGVDGIVRVPRRRKDRKLFKDAFVVELVDGQRKFRHLFLFDDVFVSAKLKVSNRGEQYAIKWYCSLYDILFYPTKNSESAQTVPVTSNIEIENLKAKIATIKADIRQEQGLCEGVPSDQIEKLTKERRMSTSSVSSLASRPPLNTGRMEKLKRRLGEQEAALWLALPSLPLTIYRRSGKTHRFLFPSDVARGDWKREISTHQQKATASLGPLSPLEIQGLAETCLEMRTLRSLGSVNLKDDDNVFTGVLYVVVNSGKGFVRPIDCYVVLEVDYLGHYVRKARTKICRASQDPSWEEGFHIEVEGTQFIKVLCYHRARMKGDELCGQGVIKLEKDDLGERHYHDYPVILDKQGCIMVSIQYSATLEGIHHRRSVSSSGVFGVSLDTVVEREKSDIPLVVIACCQEIERRGIGELGIYRVSGVSSDVRRLKEKFDENSQEALVYISEADIHAVAGTLKQYFRELPDPLFTADLYANFTEALEMKDEEKEKHMLNLLEKLPPSRKSTALFLIDHLRRVSQHEAQNKMSLGNLATIFGPNLLRPPKEKPQNSSSTSESIAMKMASGTFNVMSQTSIFYWYLKSQSGIVKLQATPEISKRIFPAKKDTAARIPRLSSQSEDKLI